MKLEKYLKWLLTHHNYSCSFNEESGNYTLAGYGILTIFFKKLPGIIDFNQFPYDRKAILNIKDNTLIINGTRAAYTTFTGETENMQKVLTFQILINENREVIENLLEEDVMSKLLYKIKAEEEAKREKYFKARANCSLKDILHA